MKMGYLCVIWMNKYRYQLPLYCQNLVEMWLNRFPITPKLPPILKG